MMKNIFVIGLPGCGKTILIMEILKELKLDACSFYFYKLKSLFDIDFLKIL